MDILSSATTKKGMARVVVMTALLMTAVNGDKHGWDNNVCAVQPDNPGPGLPDLPSTFSLRVEANLLMKQQTITLHEYYDYNDNVGAVKMTESGMDSSFFYMYNSNQFLQVTPDNLGGHYCYSSNLNGTDNHDMFGLKAINSTMDHIFSVKGALHYGGPDIHQNYLGKETVRGIPCNKWRSCQYWPDLDATSNVIWYFSDTTQWTSITGMSTPVRCHVTGAQYQNQTFSVKYEHIYEFYDFQTDITANDRHFEVPSNTMCFSESNTKALPSLPNAYSFDVENLDIITNTVTFMREEYDQVTQLLRFDYRENSQEGSFSNARYLSQYHDFNTGVAYIIDVLRARCTTSVIPRNGFDDKNQGGADVRFRNPNEFMDLDHNYVYQGVRSTRGIDCDTWAVQRFDYPNTTSNSNPMTVWTWYFATADWLRSMGFEANLVMPVMLEIFGDYPQQIHKQLSFYEYSVDQPNFLTWDLSPCFDTSHSQNYAFLVQGSYSEVVQGDLPSFKYSVLASLQAAINIPALRIARLDVQAAGANTLVTFDLLDKAPLPGDVVRQKEEPDLQAALTSLNNSISSGQLKISVASTQIFTVLPAGSQYQLQSSSSSSSSSRQKRSVAAAPSPSESGYSAGAMGGMAMGMLVLGAAIGFLVMLAVYKVRGGSFRNNTIPMKKFENEG